MEHAGTPIDRPPHRRMVASWGGIRAGLIDAVDATSVCMTA
jgi:hypothetical protein